MILKNKKCVKRHHNSARENISKQQQKPNFIKIYILTFLFFFNLIHFSFIFNSLLYANSRHYPIIISLYISAPHI